MSLEIHPQIAIEPETCFRCVDIGLPENGIDIGELFIALTQDGLDKSCKNACMDCFERLQQEIHNQP